MRRNIYVLLALLTLSLAGCDDAARPGFVWQDLNGRWEFRMIGDSVWHEATVPGTVHTDLYKNVLIDDPFYRDNESKLQWIDTLNWIYVREFEPDPALFTQDSIEVVFEGLDTYATVWLNDQQIITADNMFRSWRANISGLLKKGQLNTIRIEFQSPTRYLEKEYDQQPFSLPAANDKAEKVLSVYARKAPYHFGWDWGPRFVTSGIWKSVSLRGWDAPHLRNVFYETVAVDSASADIRLTASVVSAKKQSVKLTVTDENSGILIFEEKVDLNPGENQISTFFDLEKPRLWWPNGLGEPYLYTLNTKISSGSSHSSINTRLGVRTVELIRDPDESGESFYFKVNEIPVFMKGANYIPQDNFVNHVMSTEYEHLIQSAKAANMNMLRVWGGGIYEMDYFYDLCDSHGLLVWQDFMFACSMYPGDQAYLDNVEAEVRENIIRLRNHPSIALWCGNNEVQDAWFNWGWQHRYTEEQRRKIGSDYERLFHELLPGIVEELDPERPYWPSSPASGVDFGQVSNTFSGDLHYWGVWHSRLPFESYAEVIPRFSSEYGFQSFPDIKTVYSYTLPEDREITSPVMLAHQKHPVGNQLIMNYMERYYPVPEDFEGFLYMSQVMQGEGIRFGIEALRRSMPYCMGSLYWQLNDCWPVASWSGIDYFGRWKALHYQAREAYAPLLLSFHQKQDSLALTIVSDKTIETQGQLQIELLDFSGKVLWSELIDLTVMPLQSEQIWQVALSSLPDIQNQSAGLLVSGLFTAENNEKARALHYFERSNNLLLRPPDIRMNTDLLESAQTIELKSTTLVRQLCLVYPGETEVRFDPNYFDLLPNQTVRVKVHKRSRDPFDPEKISWMSVNDYSQKPNKPKHSP